LIEDLKIETKSKPKITEVVMSRNTSGCKRRNIVMC
jgi:hypothetical protein